MKTLNLENRSKTVIMSNILVLKNTEASANKFYCTMNPHPHSFGAVTTLKVKNGRTEIIETGRDDVETLAGCCI